MPPAPRSRVHVHVTPGPQQKTTSDEAPEATLVEDDRPTCEGSSAIEWRTPKAECRPPEPRSDSPTGLSDSIRQYSDIVRQY